jgi:hypothetical protein
VKRLNGEKGYVPTDYIQIVYYWFWVGPPPSPPPPLFFPFFTVKFLEINF